jgi:hypothetical protein
VFRPHAATAHSAGAPPRDDPPSRPPLLPGRSESPPSSNGDAPATPFKLCPFVLSTAAALPIIAHRSFHRDLAACGRCSLASNAKKLHLPSGADTFASRKAYRLGYRSQRESSRDRSSSRAFALREKIGGRGGIGDYIAKPKGMHARTFKRAMEKVYAAEEIVDRHCDLLLERLKRLRSH